MLNSCYDLAGFRVTITSVDEKYLLCGTISGSVKVFDLDSLQQLFEIKDIHKDGVFAIAISKNNDFIYTGGADGTIKVFSFKTQGKIHEFKLDGTFSEYESLTLIY